LGGKGTTNEATATRIQQLIRIYQTVVEIVEENETRRGEIGWPNKSISHKDRQRQRQTDRDRARSTGQQSLTIEAGNKSEKLLVVTVKRTITAVSKLNQCSGGTSWKEWS
jgi:hypothetical protein